MLRIKRMIILGTVGVGVTAVLLLLTHLQTAVAATTASPASQNQFPIITATLYDATLGGTPDTQNMFYLTQPSPPFPPSQATQTFTNGLTVLDSTATNQDYAGYFGDTSVPVLSRTYGYTLHFTVQIESEAHANNNRAGFSVILLGDDAKGIELGFWQDEIWAQNDDSNAPGDLFTHGEGAAFDTTNELIDYELEIFSDTYTLLANDTAVLTGPIRDYSNFTGPIPIYETPNFVFLGDDTTSAQARIRLSYVGLTVNEPPNIFSVSGSITALGSNPLADVTISTGSGYNTISDANGDYTLTDLAPGTYTLTPVKIGYSFTPTFRTVVVPPSAVNQNFTATAQISTTLDLIYLPSIYRPSP